MTRNFPIRGSMFQSFAAGAGALLVLVLIAVAMCALLLLVPNISAVVIPILSATF